MLVAAMVLISALASGCATEAEGDSSAIEPRATTTSVSSTSPDTARASAIETRDPQTSEQGPRLGDITSPAEAMNEEEYELHLESFVGESVVWNGRVIEAGKKVFGSDHWVHAVVEPLDHATSEFLGYNVDFDADESLAMSLAPGTDISIVGTIGAVTDLAGAIEIDLEGVTVGKPVAPRAPAEAAAESEIAPIPNLVGLILEDARADLDRRVKVDVESDGLFGAVDESAWEVCAQLPEAGSSSLELELTVRRPGECIDGVGDTGDEPVASAPSTGAGAYGYDLFLDEDTSFGATNRRSVRIEVREYPVERARIIATIDEAKERYRGSAHAVSFNVHYDRGEGEGASALGVYQWAPFGDWSRAAEGNPSTWANYAWDTVMDPDKLSSPAGCNPPSDQDFEINAVWDDKIATDLREEDAIIRDVAAETGVTFDTASAAIREVSLWVFC